MTQVTKRFIAANAVDETKVRLSNNSALKARNAAGSADVEIVKVNASDKIEFLSVPQVTADAVAGNDLVRKSQMDAALEGLKPKAAVIAASIGSNVAIATLNAGDLLDGVTLVAGDRVLLKDQSDASENGIYVIAAAEGDTARAADMNASSEVLGAYTVIFQGTVNAGYSYVVNVGPSFVLDTDDMPWVPHQAPVNVVGGDMITVSGATISVDLSSTGGLVSTNPGNAAGQLSVKLEASTPSLQIDGSNQLGVKLPAAGAIENTADGIAINLEASNPSLQISSTELGVKLDAAGAIVKGASGVAVQIASSNPSLAITTNALDVKINAAGGLEASASGIQANVDATNGSTKINASNEIEALKPSSEIITLDADDITAQYVDLAKKAFSAASISVVPVGAIEQEQGVDYTVTLDQGGVTRISFAGDLASAGAAALVAGDKLIIKYSWL